MTFNVLHHRECLESFPRDVVTYIYILVQQIWLDRPNASFSFLPRRTIRFVSGRADVDGQIMPHFASVVNHKRLTSSCTSRPRDYCFRVSKAMKRLSCEDF